MNRDQPGTSSSRAFIPVYLLAVAVAMFADLRGPSSVRDIVYAATAFIPVVGIPLGVRVNRISKPLPWHVLTTGLAVAAAANTVAGFGELGIQVPGGDVLVAWLYPVAYLTVLVASGIVVARNTPQDAGPVIDAALIGACGAAMLWEWVLRPGLAPEYQTPANKITVLVSTLVLMAVLGSLLHVTRTIGAARASLVFMFISLSCSIAGRVIDQLGHADSTYPLWILGNVSLAAAALHPAAAHVTTATNQTSAPVTNGRLVRLGLVLAVIPVVGAVPQLFGQLPDGLLLTAGSLVTIPLVLVRVGQLSRQRTQAQQALVYQAAHDELTGLPNRRAVLERLSQAAAEFNAGKLDQLTVLFCDLDGFKPINDQLGHQIGDEVLKIAASRLRDCVRATDLVGRIGGDEFIVVCPSAGDADILSRVQHVFDEPLLVSTGTVQLGVSVGVADTSPGTPTTGDALVATADEAMYEVKRARHAAVS